MINSKRSKISLLVIGLLLPIISLSFKIENDTDGGEQLYNSSDLNSRRSNRPMKRFRLSKISRTVEQSKGCKQDDTNIPKSLESSTELIKSPKSSETDYGIQTNRENCLCVPYYLCNNGKVIDDGEGLINPRIGSKKNKSKTIKEQLKANPLYCGTFHICCSEPQSKPVQPYVHRCGIQNPSGINSRILSPDKRNEANFGEWPWQAAILESSGGNNLFQCGGTLIDDYFIVTVAHCVAKYVENFGLLKVRLGEWDTSKENEYEVFPHEDFAIEGIIIHPEFRKGNLWNDIALIKLDHQVRFKGNIDSVCLPNYDENHDQDECVTTGWGKTNHKRGQYSTILKETTVRVVSRENCEIALRQTRVGARFKLHPGFICAGGDEGRDSCEGDGGGPLVCERKDGTYALVGLVSWGIECGKPGVPGVYVDLTKYLDWIISITGKEISYYSPGSHNSDPGNQ